MFRLPVVSEVLFLYILNFQSASVRSLHCNWLIGLSVLFIKKDIMYSLIFLFRKLVGFKGLIRFYFDLKTFGEGYYM